MQPWAEVVAIVAAARVPLPGRPPRARPRDPAGVGVGKRGGPAGAPRGSASRKVAPCARLSLSADRAPLEAAAAWQGPRGVKPSPLRKAGVIASVPSQQGAGSRSRSTARSRTQDAPRLPPRPRASPRCLRICPCAPLPARPRPDVRRGPWRSLWGTQFAGLIPSTLWVLKISFLFRTQSETPLSGQ